MQDLDQTLVGLANFGLGHAVPHFQNFHRAAFGWRQLPRAPDGGGILARIAGGVFAQHLMRVVHTQPGPGALLFGLFTERLCLPLPNAVLFDLLQKLLF